MVTALKASHSDTKRYHNEMITTLQKQYQKLQHRLDAMYVDKLDGTISQHSSTRRAVSGALNRRTSCAKSSNIRTRTRRTWMRVYGFSNSLRGLQSSTRGKKCVKSDAYSIS